jgi:hypothetical protein
MLRRVTLVTTDISEELTASIIRITKLGELGTTLDITINRTTLRRNLPSVVLLLVTANVVPSWPILVILMMEAIGSSETSTLTTAA